MSDFKPFSLTHVQYLKSDKYFGFLFSLITLFPIFLVSNYVLFILFLGLYAVGIRSKKDKDSSQIFMMMLDWIKWIGMALIGQLTNEALNFGLKEFIKEPRPQSPVTLDKSSYGMPSSHSQFMWYIVGLFLVWLYSSKSPLAKSTKILRLFILMAIFLVSVAVSYSRVYLLYHTEMQVIVGGVLGFLYGIGFGVFALTRLTLARADLKTKKTT